MNNIDMLEELKKNLDEIIKEPLGKDEMSNGNLYEYERGYELDLQEIQAISNLISENKELKEERDMYRSQVNSAFKNGFIHKSKIKEKIKELEKEQEEIKENEWILCSNINGIMIKVLQSLLGKE